MSSDECLFVRAYVLFQRNRLVVGSNLIAAKDRVNLFDRDMKPLRDQRQVTFKILDLLAEKIAGNRGVVVHEEPLLAVEEFTARSEDRDLADAIGLSERAEVVGVDHLKAPEADQQNSQDQGNKVLDGVELATRQLLCLAIGASVLRLRLVDWFHVLPKSTAVFVQPKL
jgi:hypothetical protein